MRRRGGEPESASKGKGPGRSGIRQGLDHSSGRMGEGEQLYGCLQADLLICRQVGEAMQCLKLGRVGLGGRRLARRLHAKGTEPGGWGAEEPWGRLQGVRNRLMRACGRKPGPGSVDAGSVEGEREARSGAGGPV